MFAPMSRDITLQLMQRYFEAGKLGRLSVEIPQCGTISADLDHVFRHGTGLQSFEYQTSPQNIEAIVVYGSVLFKHFPLEKVVTTRKELVFFGPEIREELTKPRSMPNDFDMMIITREGLTDDKVIVPRKKLVNTRYGTRYGSVETTIPTAVETRRPGYGYIEVGGSNLHITYRSVEQLLSGLGKGDTVSESVVRYGIPVIGQNRFREIIRNVTSPKREAQHFVEWEEDLDGRLQGRIL